MPGIPVGRRWRQEGQEFKVSLEYLTSCLKKTKQKKRERERK